MKTIRLLIVAALGFLAFASAPSLALADLAPPAELPAGTAEIVAAPAAAASASLGLYEALVAVLTPLILYGVRLAVPRIPKAFLPLSAPLVGFLLSLLAHFAGADISPILGAALGLAGVGLREMQNQLGKAGAGMASPTR